MSATKLRLFIGSSTEAVDYANALQENLEKDADCTVWTQGVFNLSGTIFSELLRNLGEFDCAVFIFSPHDKLVLRGKDHLAVRDNVLFELGLFCGRLGAERVFIVAPYDVKDMRIPTDLAGVTFANYQSGREDGNHCAILGAACNQIRKKLRRLSSAPHTIPLVKRAGFFSNFSSDFPSLLHNSKNIVLYFIHSRRFRENHNDQIIEFLSRKQTRLQVILPNLRNSALIKSIQMHFDDGPRIPGFIADAYDYFKRLQKRFGKKVGIEQFNTYPTYSFYKFDDQLVIAAYPTTPWRRDVPAIEVNTSHPVAKFVLQDLAILLKKKRVKQKA